MISKPRKQLILKLILLLTAFSLMTFYTEKDAIKINK